MRTDRSGRGEQRLAATPALPALVTLITVLLAVAACSVGPGRGDYHPPSGPASLSPVARDNTTDTATSPGTGTPVPRPRPVNRCAANTAAQLVLVDISEQHAWFCAAARTVYSTAVTTGMDTPDTRTPTGHFRIQSKNTDATLVPSTGVPYPVKYWIPFQAPLYGFHDSSWQHFAYGSPRYRTAGSHGCVHLPLPAIEYLYRWARIGAAVYIRS